MLGIKPLHSYSICSSFGAVSVQIAVPAVPSPRRCTAQRLAALAHIPTPSEMRVVKEKRAARCACAHRALHLLRFRDRLCLCVCVCRGPRAPRAASDYRFAEPPRLWRKHLHAAITGSAAASRRVGGVRWGQTDYWPLKKSPGLRLNDVSQGVLPPTYAVAS